MANEQTFHLLYVLQTLRRYFWYVLTVVVLSGIIAIIATTPYFYPPEFRSSTILYPTSPERFDMVNLFAEEPSVYVYGGSKEVEKLDNIANMERFQLAIIDSLNLWEPYGVDPATSPHPKYEALRVYNGRVRTLRIEGNGLEVEAYDTDPQRAADMANLIAWQIDEWNKRMMLQNRSKIEQLYQNSLGRLEQQLRVVKDSAQRLRASYNILNSETQTEVLVDHLLQTRAQLNQAQALLAARRDRYAPNDTAIVNAQARVNGLQKSLRELERGNSSINLSKFRAGYDEIRSLEEIYIRLAASIKEVREKIDNLHMLNSSRVATVMLTSPAEPSDKKARPVRWLILAATLLATGLASVLGVVAIDLLITRSTSSDAKAASGSSASPSP